MAALNYYLGFKRGSLNQPFNIVAGTASAGTAVDVELRMQINNGSTATGLREIEVNVLIDMIRNYINSNGMASVAGADTPAS